MKIEMNPENLYQIHTARDARYDGKFFTCVTSTGIYCRPICPARTPKFGNCRFVRTAAEAEQQGFRACKRCRPELAPGAAPVDDAARIGELLLQRLKKGAWDHIDSVEDIAAHFDLSSRQLRRIVRQQLGISLVQLLTARRLVLAFHLVTKTDLPITDIAFQSGFSSLRRFNTVFAACYGVPPRELRKEK